MGAIRRQSAKAEQVVFLYANHTVGRASSCELILDRPFISSHHASLRWTEGLWTLRDLGSRNGTFVNGRRLGFGVDQRAVDLALGDLITFADEGERWELIDASEPRSMLVSLESGPETIVLDNHGVHAFPSAEDPSVTIYQQQGRWQLERDGDCEEARDGQELELGGRRYRFLVAELIEPTAEATSMSGPRRVQDMSLEIEVARDEESAAVIAQVGGERHELPQRTTFYLLAFLARLRREQASTRGADAGWIGVDTVCQELGLASSSALGLLVHRCRKAFEDCGVEDPAAIVDRSRRGQLRIGVAASQLVVTRACEP